MGAGALRFLRSMINGRRYSVGLEDSRKSSNPETESLHLI